MAAHDPDLPGVAATKRVQWPLLAIPVQPIISIKPPFRGILKLTKTGNNELVGFCVDVDSVRVLWEEAKPTLEVKSMRRITVTVVLAAAAFFYPLTASAAPGDGIAGSKHDFTDDASQDVGLCTFCHTPHQASSTKLLWNHELTTNTFSWDVPSTTAGTTFPTVQGDTYQGPSVKCLSCHDGSVAIGDVNWFNGGDPGILWNRKFSEGEIYAVGYGGDMGGNHPLAVPYPYNNVANTYNGSTTGDGIQLGEWQADPVSLGIRMFNDDGSGNIAAGPVAGQTGIECSSCHDVHNKASVGLYLLRGTLTGNDSNYICLKCHVK